MAIDCSNPAGVHAPLSLYSQTVSVARGAELVFFLSGQVGVRPDGSTPSPYAVRAARLKHFGHHQTASTAVFVSQLVDPAWFVEVDAIAAR